MCIIPTMLHDGREYPLQRDLYLEAVERRRRRVERERQESVHAMKGLVLACLFGLMLSCALLWVL
jgi:hypothetical protein